MPEVRQGSCQRELSHQSADERRVIVVLQIIGLCLAVLACFDRRAWPAVLLVLTLWMGTQIAEGVDDRIVSLGLRVPIDLIGVIGAMFLARQRVLFALFVLMLLNHATYWFAYSIKVNLWWFYPHALNGLWLAQMIVVAQPGGKNLVGACASTLRGFAHRRGGRRVGVGQAAFGQVSAGHSLRQRGRAYVRFGGDLQLSKES